MSAFHQVTIGGYPSGGLMTDRKPLMLPDQAWSKLDNAYVFRQRTKKRDGSVSMGRLQRILSNSSLGTSGASPWTFNVFSLVSPAITEPNKQINAGSVTITIGSTPPIILKDNIQNGVLFQSGNISAIVKPSNPCQITSTAHNLNTGDTIVIANVQGMTQLNGNSYVVTVVNANTFTLNGVDNSTYGAYVPNTGYWVSHTNIGSINYQTGNVTITYNRAASATTITFGYFPTLPVMGECKRDIATLGIDETVFFDTKYAYQFSNGEFQQLGTATWSAANQSNGTNTNYFWSCNYQGATPDLRYFFVTNNNITAGSATPYDPIRYYNNSSWNDLIPQVDGTNSLLQALIVVPYYGRLVALNVWEGTTAGSPPTVATSTNYVARARFSQIGNPLASDAWRSDQFGKGGFLDAPTNEQIVSAAFYRNTLIVFFEYSTWQLRYIGEYGLPFIWERISSDFGSISTFSPVIFDQGVMEISNRGVIQAGASGVNRLDNQIPETIFGFQIQNNAPDFVHGVRDFEKELVFWNYLDVTNQGVYQFWPNSTLLFNYQNNTWAQFRDTITCLGIGQFQLGITWDSLNVSWDDANVSWDNVDNQNYVDYVIAGSQHGFVSIYENQDSTSPVYYEYTNYAPSMAITAFSFVDPTQLTIPLHNLNVGEFIYIQGALWSGSDPGVNNQIYQVEVVDKDTITLNRWNQNTQTYSPVTLVSSTYLGGGIVALLPKMNIQGKDFSPFQEAGKGFKLSYIDFQLDQNVAQPAIPAATIQLFVNSYLGEQANIISSSNKEVQNTSQYVGFITNIALTNPCQITSPGHSLRTGTEIYIANVLGTTQINSAIYTITVIDANTFSLDGIDATGWTPYVTGGIWNSTPANGQIYQAGSQYAWYRFYSTQFGQYLRIGITYDDQLMNQVSTHQLPFELNAMNCWFRPGGRLIN